MTPEERNLDFTQRSVASVGFGERYTDVIAAGHKARLNVIPLETYSIPNGQSEMLVVEPSVVQQANNPGRVQFDGFRATLIRADKDPVSQFIPNFMMQGMTIDNAEIALKGGTVLHSDYDRANGEKRFVFSRLDLDTPVPRGENHPVVRVNAKDVRLTRLLSQEDIYYANPEEKEKYLAMLQTGKPFNVRVRERVNGVDKFRNVILQLHLYDRQNIGMRVMDSEGTVLREPKVPVMRTEVTQKEGVFLGQGGDGEQSFLRTY